MRSHIGFDRLWAMQIPVPYSLFLRDGPFGWSCGQCPLDRTGKVVAPDDARAQADLVGNYARTILAEAGFAPQDLKLAVVYHHSTNTADILGSLRHALGPDVQLATVSVPDFYYAGMLVEVDLFAMSPTDSRLNFVFGTPDVLRNPLIDHWSAPSFTPDLPAHATIDQALASKQVWAVQSDMQVRESHHDHLGTTVRLRQSGRFHALVAVAPHLEGLVLQTEGIMEAFGAILEAHGLGFRDVVKSTTHYVGDATPEELHRNMTVRNRRYTEPGPASTGIRVDALADPAALTAITLLAYTS